MCLDKYTGEEQWRTDLGCAEFVSISVDNNIIVACSGGHAFGIDKKEGNKIWENQLPGLGYGVASISDMGAGGMEEIVANILKQQTLSGGGAS